VLDGAMAEPVPSCPRVVAFIGKRITAGEREASALADGLTKRLTASVVKGAPRSEVNTKD
jgi:hypothetical protein